MAKRRAGSRTQSKTVTGKTPNQKTTSQGTGKLSRTADAHPLESQQVCSLESALG